MLFVISFLLPRKGGHGISLETEYCYGVIRTRIDFFLTNDADDDGVGQVSFLLHYFPALHQNNKFNRLERFS